MSAAAGKDTVIDSRSSTYWSMNMNMNKPNTERIALWTVVVATVAGWTLLIANLAGGLLYPSIV